MKLPSCKGDRFVVLAAALLVLADTNNGHAQSSAEIADFSHLREGTTDRVAVDLTARPGSQVALQRSIDLESWCSIELKTTPPSGKLRFSTLAGADAEYFRAVTDAVNQLTAFDVWCMARHALRASPDHLIARAEELVRDGSAGAIFEFIRDHIALYPAENYGFGTFRAVSAVRWGTRATLRGGAGTPREKVDLLAELLNLAGHETRVMSGLLDTSRVPVRSLLFRPIARDFNPAVDPDTLAAWLEIIGKPQALPPLQLPNVEGLQAKALVDSLSGFFPASERAQAFDWDSLTSIPILQVRVGEQWMNANPLVPGAVFGESYLIGTPSSAGDPSGMHEVRIKLEAARESDPFNRMTLVEGRWSADQISGRRVNLTFAPASDIDTLLTMTADDAETFIPSLIVDGVDVSSDLQAELAAVGKPFSRGGDIYDVSGDSVTVNGVPLGSDATPAELLARVARIEVNAYGGSFPQIGVAVKALDNAGRSIPGLGADAFTVSESGIARSFALRQNNAPPPRVLMLFDTSESIPEEFRGEQAVGTGLQIIDAIELDCPDSSFRIGTVSLGVAFPGPWTGDRATLEDHLRRMSGFGSDLWTALAKAMEAQPSLVVFITDGDTTDELTPELERSIRGQAPVIAVGVGDSPVTATLNQIADVTDGEVLNLAGVPQIASTARRWLADQKSTDYSARYRAPEEGPLTRQVAVRTRDGRLAGNTSYTVPDRERRTRAPQFSGLYLTVRVGSNEYTRTLAGHDGAASTRPVITDEELEDVDNMLFGRVTFAFEGAAPPLSVLLDDFFAEKERLAPLYAAAFANDSDGVRTALEGGLSLTPRECYLLNTALPEAITGHTLTFETSLRSVAVIQRPEFGVGHETRSDIFPLSQWATAADDAVVAFRTTMEKTGHLAILESALMGESTFSLLDGAQLQRIEAPLFSDAGFDPHTGAVWRRMTNPFRGYAALLPQSGAPFAMWAVDKDTGTLIGVLRDGSGGGVRAELDADLKRTDTLLTAIGQIGFGIPGIGVWVELEKTKARLVNRATIMLATGEPVGGFEDIGKGLACELAKEGLGAIFPPLESLFNADNRLIVARRLAGVSDWTPLDCP